MEIKKEKHLDSELLLFFLLVAAVSFFIYIRRHPLILSIINYYKMDISTLLSAYLFDLIIYLSVLVPYIIIIVVLIILKSNKKINKIKDNVMVILFFPLISFLVKAMSLLQVYISYTFSEAFIENFYFFSFLFIGPIIVAFHKLVVWFNGREKSKEGDK